MTIRPGTLRTATFAAILAATSMASAAEDADSLEGFKEIRIAPGVSTASTFIDVLLPFIDDFPEGMEGRQSLEMNIRKGDGAYVVDIVKSGYLDDSVKGEHFRGFVIPTTQGWELIDLGVRMLCYRSSTDGRCNQTVCPSCLPWSGPMFLLDPLAWARVALCLATMVPAAAQTPGDRTLTAGLTGTRLLEGALGDIVVVTAGGPREDPPDAPRPDLATVCLVNPPTASATKAFGVSEVPPPRTSAPPGLTACAAFDPAVHTIRLWTLDPSAHWRPVLTFPLDLRDRRGTAVTIDWSVEGTAVPPSR